MSMAAQVMRVRLGAGFEWQDWVDHILQTQTKSERVQLLISNEPVVSPRVERKRDSGHPGRMVAPSIDDFMRMYCRSYLQET